MEKESVRDEMRERKTFSDGGYKMREDSNWVMEKQLGEEQV